MGVFDSLCVLRIANFTSAHVMRRGWVGELLFFVVVLIIIHCSLLQTIQQQTGVTWNKRFKKQFGPINKVSNLFLGAFVHMLHVT